MSVTLPKADEEVMEMWYCESRRLVLHPGQLYRFTVDPTCPSCVRWGAEHDAAMSGDSLPQSEPAIGQNQAGSDESMREQSAANPHES
jgi:hypothetical protein